MVLKSPQGSLIPGLRLFKQAGVIMLKHNRLRLCQFLDEEDDAIMSGISRLIYSFVIFAIFFMIGATIFFHKKFHYLT